MIFDYSKLRGIIREKFGTQDKFAKALGVGRVSLSQRLNNHLEFTQEEINNSCELLEINKNDIAKYFFTIKVQKGELTRAS
ncbi:DUF739 family protein [Clostridium sardiniense]|uniref:DUF739 family protein n=1 Tax=Clostridium sardiniense TaxID=29369 RepID=UPI003D3309BE